MILACWIVWAQVGDVAEMITRVSEAKAVHWGLEVALDSGFQVWC